MSLDFKAAHTRLAQNVRGFCEKYLPTGSQKGDWWLARVPWREDRTPSLGVHLHSGRWKDFGREGDRGDLIDLLSRIERRPAADIVRGMSP